MMFSQMYKEVNSWKRQKYTGYNNSNKSTQHIDQSKWKFNK